MSQAPLIIGGGPAGCAAAILLARNGASPLVIDRDETPRDPLCGGFLSWRTLEQLRALGCDPHRIGGHGVTRLRLFTPHNAVELPLPHPAIGLSRHALDSCLRDIARQAGVRFACDTITRISQTTAHGRTRDWAATSLFLASGKHDVRGLSRARNSHDGALGLRLRLPPTPERGRMLSGAIELHLFAGGYAGIVLQEDGWANICLAVRKSALGAATGSPRALLDRLAATNEPFAQRIGDLDQAMAIESIGSVPYGFIARTTTRGLFRIGDQAAVIPSLAGEGIGIALASGGLAAQRWLQGGSAAAEPFQREFGAQASRPLRLAGLLWQLAESPLAARIGVAGARIWPGLVARIAEATRIEASGLPCTRARPC